jgi:hypothetical protein
VVIAGYGSGVSTVATSRASNGETVMAYLPNSGTGITVDMTKLSGTDATAYWYDPVADLATLIGHFPTFGSLQFTSPGAARVLILDDTSKNFPPPAAADAVFDPGPPDEVVGVRLSKVPSATLVSWTSQNSPAGDATGYELIKGLISDLAAPNGYGKAVCLATGVPDTPYDDTRRNPTPGTGYYYLVRARNVSGASSWGSHALDANSPCP